MMAAARQAIPKLNLHATEVTIDALCDLLAEVSVSPLSLCARLLGHISVLKIAPTLFPHSRTLETEADFQTSSNNIISL